MKTKLSSLCGNQLFTSHVSVCACYVCLVEVTSMEDQDDLVSQLIDEAIKSGDGNEQNPTVSESGR